VLQLSESQRETVSGYHQQLVDEYSASFDIDRSSQARQLSRGMRIASFLGALALAASVFLLFHQFWGHFGTVGQAAILVAAPALLFVATMLVDSRDDSGYYVKLVAMVAFACFVLDVSMLWQIFSITPSDIPLLPWAVFALLLAYALDIRLLLVAGLLCLVALLSARTGTWGGLYWLSAGERPENYLPVGVLLFFLPRLVNQARHSGFAATYRIFGLLTTLIPLLILGHWGLSSYLVTELGLSPGLVEGTYQVAGFVVSGLAIGLGIRQSHPEVVNTGTVFFVIFLYTKFFDWWWEVMPKYLFFLLIGLTAILFIATFKRLRGPGNRPDRAETAR
jgi:hypothetical protein